MLPRRKRARGSSGAAAAASRKDRAAAPYLEKKEKKNILENLTGRVYSQIINLKNLLKLTFAFEQAFLQSPYEQHVVPMEVTMKQNLVLE